MTFEKALEAMKQGKKVTRKYWNRKFCISISPENDVNGIYADDWEIYEEEPKQETEMTAEKSAALICTVANTISNHRNEFEKIYDYYHLENALEALYYAVKVLEDQNQPEKKCECKCSQETSCNENLQEEMRQALSRKFFELERIEEDSLAVSNMLDVYRLLFEVAE